MKNIGKGLLGLILVIFSISLFTESCKHQPIFPNHNGIDTTHIDTNKVIIPTNPKDSVCYDEEIQPLFTTYCATAGCHDNISRQEGINMTSYAKVKATITGTKLWKYINHNPGKPMPPLGSPQLSQVQIDLIKKWIDEGMKQGIDCGKGCDTTNVTYTKQISALMSNACIGCHSGSSPSAGVSLDSYTQVKSYATSGKLAGCVKHLNGFKPMPPAPSPILDACKIRQIELWISAGMPQ